MSDKVQDKMKMNSWVAGVILRYNLPAIAVLVAIEIVCVILVNDKTLIAVVSTATGGVITALLNERLMLIQYYFGSSRGSQEKQDIIEKQIDQKEKQI